jgi:hypothetical protein
MATLIRPVMPEQPATYGNDEAYNKLQELGQQGWQDPFNPS